MIHQRWNSEANLGHAAAEDLSTSNSKNHEGATLASRLRSNASDAQAWYGSIVAPVALAIAAQVGSRVGDAFDLFHQTTGVENLANGVFVGTTTRTYCDYWKRCNPLPTGSVSADECSGSDDSSTNSTAGFCKNIYELPV